MFILESEQERKLLPALVARKLDAYLGPDETRQVEVFDTLVSREYFIKITSKSLGMQTLLARPYHWLNAFGGFENDIELVNLEG